MCMAGEKCILDPERDCLGLIKARELELDVAELRHQNSSSHERLYNRLNEVEKAQGIQETQYSNILEKLTALAAAVEELKSKPAKRWESLVGYALSAVAGAFLLWLAAGMPGLG